MTTTKDYLQQAMEAMLGGDSDRALGLMLRASLAYDDGVSQMRYIDGLDQFSDEQLGDIIATARTIRRERQERDIRRQSENLKPIQPISAKVKVSEDFDYQKFEPAQGRLRNDSPSLVPCPVCGAPKGYLCVQVIGENIGELLTGKNRPGQNPSPSWHDQRRSKARNKRGANG